MVLQSVVLLRYFASPRESKSRFASSVGKRFRATSAILLAGCRWYLDSFFGIFSNPVGLTLVGIAGAAAIIGARKLLAEHADRFLLLVIPIGLALLASGLHLYPFQGRLLLFSVPSLILLIAAGLGTIQTETKDVLPLLGPLLLGLLFLQPLWTAARDFRQPRGVEESRPVIQYIEKHRSEGDILYAYYSAEYALDYYRQRGLIGPIDLIVGVESRENWRAYREDLDRLRGQKRVWVLFSHVWTNAGADEERLFVDHLDDIGERLDAVQAPGTSAYLYDLSVPPERAQ